MIEETLLPFIGSLGVGGILALMLWYLLRNLIERLDRLTEALTRHLESDTEGRRAETEALTKMVLSLHHHEVMAAERDRRKE